MRTHEQIVRDRGATRLFSDLQALGRGLAPNTPQRWAERNRIPADWWADVVQVGAATMDELTAAARPRKRPTPRTGQHEAA